MPCYHPLDAKLSPSGKPIFKNNTNFGRFTRLVKLPCGRCIGCKLDRSKTWAIRLMHEAQLHEANSFITLTIDKDRASAAAAADAARPRAPVREPQDPYATTDEYAHALDRAHAREISLSKTDLRVHLKRLREDTRYRSSTTIKYYAVGEYGETTKRPHYHIALFGEAFFDDRYLWRTTEGGDDIYRSSRLERLWPYGNCEIGNLTFKSAAYIARYITKKLNPGRTDESQRRFDEHYMRTAEDGSNYWIEPEFALISRRPGLGKTWFEKYHTDVYPHDYVVMNGQKLKPPRFYDQLLEAFKPIELELIKKEREEKAKTAAADNTPARLRVKEQVAIAKLALNKRKLE